MQATHRIPARFPVRASDSMMGAPDMHDFLIRVVITLDGHTAAALLARALRLSLDAAPIAGCRLVRPVAGARGRAYFERVSNLDAVPLLEVFALADEAEVHAALERWSLTPLDPGEGPLVRAALFRVAAPAEAQTSGCDTLCLRLHHSLGDGAGTIDYLYLLSAIYTALERDPAYRPVPNVRGGRSYWQIIKRLSLAELRQALRRPKFPPFDNAQWTMPRPPAGNGPGILVARELAPGRLGTIRAYSKAHNATVNDVLLAAWYRAIYRLAQPPVGAHLAVMTHLNLRRRLPKRQAGAIANLSQIAFTSIGTELGATLADTVLRVHAEMERIKDTPPMLGRMLPMSRRQMQRRMARLPRPPRFGPGVPMFNNIGQIDPARLRLGVPAENAYLTACLGREGDTSLQVVITTCGGHVNLAVVTREINNNREILTALLDAFEEELAATA